MWPCSVLPDGTCGMCCFLMFSHSSVFHFGHSVVGLNPSYLLHWTHLGWFPVEVILKDTFRSVPVLCWVHICVHIHVR